MLLMTLALSWEQAEKTLFAVTEKRVSSAFTGIDTLLVDAFEELQEMAAQENKISGVASGFKDVDDLFHGFGRRPGHPCSTSWCRQDGLRPELVHERGESGCYRGVPVAGNERLPAGPTCSRNPRRA